MTATAARAAAFAALLGGLAGLWAVPHRGLWFGASLALHLGATAGWLWLCRAVVVAGYRPSFGRALLVAVALRALVLPLSPELSDDVWRYLFEGRLVLEGHNPYVTAPSDEAVAALRGPYHDRINNPELSAAYPPAVQLVLAAAVAVAEEPWAIKLAFALLDLAGFALLWSLLPRLGLPAARAVVAGWCPLLAIEFAGEGHGDSLAMAATIATAWALRADRRATAGAALAVATAGKLLPAVLLPWLVRAGGRRALVVFAAVLAALYLPFVPWADPAAGLRGTFEYAARWRSNDSLFALIHGATAAVQGWGWLADVETQRLAKVPLLALGVGWLWWMARRRWSLERAALGFFLFFVAATPTLHPWYLALLLPWLALAPNPGWLAFAGTVFLAYHVLPGWLTERRWEERGWVKAIEYLPLYLGFALAWRRVSRREGGE